MIFKIKEFVKPIVIDRSIRRILITAIVFNIIAAGLAAFRAIPFIQSGKIAALHYNVYLKVSDVGSAAWLFLPVAIGFFILLVNTILIARICLKNRQHALALAAVTLFYELLLFAAVLFMTYINLYR